VLDFLVVVNTTFVGYDLRKLAKKSNCAFVSATAKKEAAQLLEVTLIIKFRNSRSNYSKEPLTDF
jgi:hypothetical protein